MSRTERFARSTLGALVWAFVAPASAEPCAPRAEVSGDAAAVQRVTAELAAIGVTRGRPAPGCRGVVAEVELAGDGGIAVAIRDGARRSEGRVVSDAAVAASWIDSWLRDDLDGMLWLLAAPTTTIVNAPGVTVAKPVASRPLLDRVALSVGYEQSWLGDGASASGGSVAACVRSGSLCLGARARYAHEADRAVNLTAMARSDISVLATASLPIAVGRMTIAPELGAGLGRMTTRRLEDCSTTPPGCDPTNPMDPGCMGMPPACVDPSGNSKLYIGDGLSAATFTPRLAGAVRIAVPLFEHVWLDGIASLAFGPFAHTEAFTSTAMIMNPDGTVGTLGEEASLPGEPQRTFVLGVGLRVGAP